MLTTTLLGEFDDIVLGPNDGHAHRSISTEELRNSTAHSRGVHLIRIFDRLYKEV